MNKNKHKTTIILIKPILVFYPIKMNKHKHKTTITFNQTNSNFLSNMNHHQRKPYPIQMGSATWITRRHLALSLVIPTDKFFTTISL